jgi:Nucleotidyltransferase domain
MHIYAFGSICRGEIYPNSDVDLLVIGGGAVAQYDPAIYSIYSYERIQDLWSEGNPFAWHLSLESRLLFSSDDQDFLQNLGKPAPYCHCARDCEKFFSLFRDARTSLTQSGASRIFDLSSIFLSIRNIATCFSLGVVQQPDFSRSSALRLGTKAVPLSLGSYQVLERARVLSTRGYGSKMTDDEIDAALRELDGVYDWMRELVERSKEYERV